jgi:hypothetical protein
MREVWIMDFSVRCEDLISNDYESWKIERKIKESKAKIEFDKIYEQLKNKIIPDKYSKDLLDVGFEYRGKIIKEQGFALLTNEWIDKFSKWIGNKKCLEIMSGSGALTKTLRDRNIDIIATDNFSWHGYNSWNDNKNYWTEIEDLDCIEAIEKYKDRDVVIMSWAYMDDNAYKCLLKMREVNPDMTMVVIGEGWGGCTASENFFDNIAEVDDKEMYDIDLIYPRWNGIYDHIQLVK